MSDYDFDTGLLALQWELAAFLSEHDILQFQDYDSIEVSMSDHELKVHTKNLDSKVQSIFREWCRQNRFDCHIYSDLGYVTLVRKQ